MCELWALKWPCCAGWLLSRLRGNERQKRPRLLILLVFFSCCYVLTTCVSQVSVTYSNKKTLSFLAFLLCFYVMPNMRHPDKRCLSCWVEKGLYIDYQQLCESNGQTMTERVEALLRSDLKKSGHGPNRRASSQDGRTK